MITRKLLSIGVLTFVGMPLSVLLEVWVNWDSTAPTLWRRGAIWWLCGLGGPRRRRAGRLAARQGLRSESVAAALGRAGEAGEERVGEAEGAEAGR